MSDPTIADDRTDEERADATVSRRGLLAGLGLVGGVAGLLSRGLTGRSRAAVTQSSGLWRVDIQDETAVQVGPADRVDIEDEAYTGGENVRFGRHNAVIDGVAGATIAGGGMRVHRDGDVEGNVARSHFGTVGGGIDNTVGNEAGPATGILATVGGGAGNLAAASSSTVAGGKSNEATGPRATVGGGINNEATDAAATVGGGIGNHAAGRFASVAGGGANAATERYANAAGGRGNRATAESATVAGGHNNAAEGRQATVGGGYYNRATGPGAVVPGGADNVADGEYTFATGYHADANGHDGAFVVGDSSDDPIHADSDDAAFFQMPIRAPAFETTSSRAAKTDVEPVDPESVLEGVRELDVAHWRFRGDDAKHLGPMAADFRNTFDVGPDHGSIASVDADGAALAAIQGLALALDETTDRIEELEADLERRDDRIDDLEDRLTALEKRLPDQASP